MVGDILVSVNDWPLINTPHQYSSSNGNGNHNESDADYDASAKAHFETVLRLLRLATPPRKIRFMRSKEAATSLMTGENGSNSCSGITGIIVTTSNPNGNRCPFS